MTKKKALSPLQQIEREVLEEGKEWMKKRLEERLQQLADEDGEISPPQRGGAGSPASKPRRTEKRGGDD